MLGSVPLDLFGSTASLLLGFPLFLPAFRSGLLISRFAFLLALACLLAADLLGVPRFLPLLAPFGRTFRVAWSR